MDARPWLELLRHELARQNLPPFYVERLVEELSDHLTDFMEDRMSTDAKDLRTVVRRLGTVRDIAAAAQSEFRRTTFWGRHPVVGFVVLPIVALPLLWIAAFGTTLLVGSRLGLGSDGGASASLNEWAAWAMPGMLFLLVFAPIVTVAAMLCRMGSRAGVDWKWTVIACAIVAVVGGTAAANIVLPAAGARGSIAFGFAFSQVPSLAQLLQFAAPMALGIWAGWRQSGRSQSVLAQ